MSKQRKIILTVFYFWLAISSQFCFFLDLFMSVYQPEAGHEMWRMGIDQSLVNQLLYLSVWCTIAISVWSILNLVAFIAPKMPKWVSSKNNATFISALSITVFIVYLATMLGSRDNIEGFDNWYKILKSSIEHFLNPVLLIVVYFTLLGGVSNTRKYAKNQAWWILLFVSVYVLFLVVREAVLLHGWSGQIDYGHHMVTPGDLIPDAQKHFGVDGTSSRKPFNLFPYIALDPLDQPDGLNFRWVPALIGIEFIPYGIEVLFNYLNNLSFKSMSKRYPKFFK